MMTDTQKTVLETVQAMNRAWTSGRTAELRKFFHPAMVAVTPMDARRLDGQEACIASWQRFVDNTEIKEWKETEPLVRVFGDSAAVVSYYYAVKFEMGGEQREEKGRDLFFLVREAGEWRVVADQFSPFPAG